MKISNYKDYELSLKEKGDGKVYLDIKKPIYLEHEGIGMSVETLHCIVCHVFEQLPVETCKTIEFGFFTFEREDDELDFYKEVSKKIEF